MKDVMKEILVPCDFSNEAIEAWKFATTLAARADLDIRVIHSIELPIMVSGFDVQAYTYDPTLEGELREIANRNFKEMKQRFDTDRKATFEVIVDSVLGAVNRTLEKENTEIIIMGTKGVNGVNEFLFGSNTERVVRRATVPVLAIRRAPDINSVRKIVFPNSLRTDQTELLKRVVDLQRFFDAHLYLLWVNTPDNFVPDSKIIATMRQFVEQYQLRNYSLEIFNDVSEGSGIMNFTRQVNADMIAMGTNGRRGLAHLLMGSIAEDVVNHVECPIWTYCTHK